MHIWDNEGDGVKGDLSQSAPILRDLSMYKNTVCVQKEIRCEKAAFFSHPFCLNAGVLIQRNSLENILTDF